LNASRIQKHFYFRPKYEKYARICSSLIIKCLITAASCPQIYHLRLHIEWRDDEALNALRVKLFRRKIKAKTYDDKIVNATRSKIPRFSSRKYRSKHGAFLSRWFKNNRRKNVIIFYIND
jgi:hypothetical protein